MEDEGEDEEEEEEEEEEEGSSEHEQGEATLAKVGEKLRKKGIYSIKILSFRIQT
jgi:hypothetical protein